MPHPAVPTMQKWDVRLAVPFTRSLGLLVGTSSGNPPQIRGWSESSKSYNKAFPAQPELLTPADFMDKTSALSSFFFKHVRVSVGRDFHQVQPPPKAGPPWITSTRVPELTHGREQGCNTEMLVDVLPATTVTLHHLHQVNSVLR